MAIQEETVTIPIRPNRRAPWLLGIVVVVLLLGLVIAASLWSARPRWRTYVFPADPSIHIAVAIDYPDTLEIIKSAPFNVPGTFQRWMEIRLQRKPPTGMVRWLLEKLLRRKSSQWEHIDIVVYAHTSDIDAMATQEHANPNASSFRLEHRRHPLGPALDIIETINFTQLLRRGRIVGNPSTLPNSLGVSETWIYPAAVRGIDKTLGSMAILVGCTTPNAHHGLLSSEYREIVQRVHLVKK